MGNITLNDIGGYEYEKKEAYKVVNFFKNYDEFIKNGASLPNGIFFYGRPGNGKTMFANAIANDAGVPCFRLSKEESVDSVKMEELFDNALKNAPSIIIIDEIDQLIDCTPSRGQKASDKQREFLRSLLTEIDKVSGKGVLVIATANAMLDYVPSALVRNGRIEKHISVGNPDYNDRKGVLNIYLKRNDIFSNIGIDELAKITSGLTCSALVSLVNETLVSCLANNKQRADVSDFSEPLQVIISDGIKKKPIKNNDHIIYHEIGHFLADYKLNGNIGIINTEAYGESGGRYKAILMMDEEEGECCCQTYKDYKNQAIVAIAGLAATEVFCGEKYAGASSDLHSVFQAFKAITINGLQGFEALSTAMVTTESFNGAFKDNKGLIAETFAKFLEEVYSEAVEIMKSQKELAVTLFNRLKECKTLSTKDIEMIIQSVNK